MGVARKRTRLSYRPAERFRKDVKLLITVVHIAEKQYIHVHDIIQESLTSTCKYKISC